MFIINFKIKKVNNVASKYINLALSNNPSFNISNYCKFLMREISSGNGK